MKNLPSDVNRIIFSNITDPKNQVNYSLVCKGWNNIFRERAIKEGRAIVLVPNKIYYLVGNRIDTEEEEQCFSSAPRIKKSYTFDELGARLYNTKKLNNATKKPYLFIELEHAHTYCECNILRKRNSTSMPAIYCVTVKKHLYYKIEQRELHKKIYCRNRIYKMPEIAANIPIIAFDPKDISEISSCELNTKIIKNTQGYKKTYP